MPMPAPILLNSFNSINFPLYTTPEHHYELAYPCPQSPPGLMPPKSVSIFTSADTLDEDDDDDLPPLVEAPPATFAENEDAQNDTDAGREENAATTGAGSDPNAQGAQFGGGGMQYTFASTITPSTFSVSSPSASPGPVQAGHAFDAPSSASPGLPSYPPGLHAHRQFHAHSPTGVGFGSGMGAGAGTGGIGASAGVGVGIEPPSPSNADVGSPSPPTAPSPSFGPDSTTTSATSPSLSLALDEQREPSSGPFRLGVQAQGGGGRTKPQRPPSYIPRPPNAFILFRASFVRSQRLDAQSSAASAGAAAGVTTGGVSALGPGSVITIEPSSSPSLAASGKRGGKAGSELSGIGGGPTTPSTSLSKLAGQLWRALPAAERAVWESRARAAQAEHRAKYPDWRFRPENASGPGSGGAFWTGGGGGGGGSTMGSVPWSASAAIGGGGGGDDWGGTVAAGKHRGGGSGKDGGGGGGEGSRRRKDRDRDKEREKDREREGGGRKGKDKTGVGTSTSADMNPNASPGPGPGPGASPSLKASPTATRRGRTRNSGAATRTNTSTSALALPSWAITGLEIEEDDNTCANKDRHPSTSTSAAMTRQSSTNTEGSPRSEVVKATDKAGSKELEQSQNQEARKDASGSAGVQGAGATQVRVQGPVASVDASREAQIPSPARPASRIRENKDQEDQGGSNSNDTKKNKEVRNLATAASASAHDQTQEKTERSYERGRERSSRSDVRFAAVPLTDIARRSVSVEASQESAGERGSRSAVPSPLPVPLLPSGPVADSIAAPVSQTSTATFNESQESTSTSTGSSQAQGQDLASEFELGRAFFAGSASQQRRGSLVSFSGSASASGGSGSGSGSGSASASASAAGAGIGIPAPHQHTRSHSFSQVQTQARAQVPVHVQTQAQAQNQAPARLPISSVIPATQNRLPLPTRGANVVSRAGGPVRTVRRNTVTVAGLSGAASASPASARQFGMRFPDVSPVASPVAGPGAAHYGFGPVYPAFDRGLEEPQSSPPPLSPALSSPLSATTSSPTYAGHGSPPSEPFSATGQFSPPLHRPHPYAHARVQSFHQQVLHQAQMHGHGQAQVQAQSTVSPMMLPMQTHAQPETAFMSPVSSPSFYSHAAAHAQSREQGSPGGVSVRMDANVNANMDMDVDVASQHTASSAGTAASASSSSSTTVTSLFPPSSASVSAGGGTAPSSDAGVSTDAASTQVPLPHLSSYSSLTGWAGTASPFSPRHGSGSGMNASPGAGVYESAGFAADETSASAFSSPTYAYPPYSDIESGAWYACDLVGQGMSGGSSMEDRYAPDISAGGEMDGIAFGPGPNLASTPSPTEGPFTSQDQNPQQQQGFFTPHTPGLSQSESQSQATSVFSPPLSHSVAHTPLQYPYGGSSPSPGSVPRPFHGASHPSNVGGGFVQGYISRHPMHLHGSPGESVPASGVGAGGNVTYVLDRYPSGSSLTGGGMGGAPYQRTKERRK